MHGFYVFLGQTSASGNNGGIGLYCADHESSYEGVLVTGTVDLNCTNFNN